LKLQLDDNVDNYKGRFVARGFTQTYDFWTTQKFVPMARLDSIQTIITIVTMENMHTVQFDIKPMFFYGDIFEELYMDQVERFEDSFLPHKGYKLQKSIYGLKQVSRN